MLEQPQVFTRSRLSPHHRPVTALSRSLSGTNVTANAVHLGMVSTSFGAEDPP